MCRGGEPFLGKVGNNRIHYLEKAISEEHVVDHHGTLVCMEKWGLEAPSSPLPSSSLADRGWNLFEGCLKRVSHHSDPHALELVIVEMQSLCLSAPSGLVRRGPVYQAASSEIRSVSRSWP